MSVAESVDSGVYGFALRGLELPQRFMVPVAAGSPALGVYRVSDTSSFRDSADYVSGSLIGGGKIGMDLTSGDAFYVLPRHIPDDEMLHPWLAPAALWRAYSVGRLVIHGGLLEKHGRALAIVGHRESGKSSLTGWAASSDCGLSVLSDDVIVADDDWVFSGPRCIDLRPSSLEFFGTRASLRPSRDNTRYRIDLPPCVGGARLTGIVVLAWANSFVLRRIAPVHRLQALLEHLALIEANKPTAEKLLTLAALPMWVLERPRDSRMLDRALEVLLELLSGGGSR